MVKKRADIFLAANNSIKICVVFCVAFLLHSYGSFSANLENNSSQQDEIAKYCKGEALIVKVFDIPPNSKIDSIHFISSNSTLKFTLPTYFTKEDTLLLFFNSDTLNITGDITILTFVEGTSNAKESNIRIVPNPKIITHPHDRYACQGDQIKFSVIGSNYDSVRWEYLSPISSKWNYYGNENKSELIISANKSINDKYMFRAVLSNENTCFAYSLPAILTLDSIKPYVLCPNDTTIIIDDASCSYLFAIRPRPLSIYDACGHNESTTRRSDNKQATEPYPLGTTVVTFLVPDKSGNLGQCSYNITIQNNAITKIPCKADEIIYLDQTCKAQIRERPLSVTPPCETNTIPVFYSGALNYSQQGNYTLRHYAFHPKVEECITQVTVLDTSKYRLDYEPKDLILDTDPGKCTRILLPDPPRISNLCTSDRDKVELLIDWPDNNEFQIGTTEIQWGIFQIDGKVDTISQLITINDVSVPTVNCPGPVEAYLDPGNCSDWFEIPGLSEGGACGPVNITNDITGGENASGNFAAGETTITWTVTHNNSFFKSCPQDIIIYSHPTARNDIANTIQDLQVTIPILENDEDCLNPGIFMASISVNTLPINGIAILDNDQKLVYTPNPGFFGIDSLKYLITNTQNLIDEAWVIITVAEEPEPLICEIITQTNTSGFGASDGQATVSASGGIEPYNYLWNNGLTLPTAVNLTAGIYSVIVYDNNNKQTTCSATIFQPDALQCDIINKINISVYDANDGKATVTAKGGTAPYTYLWENGQTGIESTGLYPGSHYVTVTDFNGYETTCIVEIEEPSPPVEPCQFLIPDGFSPNGDGIGERFYIRCIEEYPNANIQIFNRYGQLIYQQNNYGNIDAWGETNAFWDGRPNMGIKPFNSILPSGTYFYVFNPGDSSKPITGSIYLNTNKEGMQ